MAITDLLTKKPFVRIIPSDSVKNPLTTNEVTGLSADSPVSYEVMYQSDFLRELYPSGHRINSPIWYPDKLKYDEKDKKFVKQKVVRCAFPFQYIILTQQLVHLCGNDIQIELTIPNPTDAENEKMGKLRQAILDRQIDTALYFFIKQDKSVGDSAIVFYMYQNKVHHKVIGYQYGDTLYPHRDSLTGEMDCFARKYDDLSEDGKSVVSWIEVWDKYTMTRYCRSNKGIVGAINSLKEMFGIEGYSQVGESLPHGFGMVPVAYKRSYGPCWWLSQENIEKYELAVSHLCQNNMAYAFPITVMKGDDVEISGDIYGDVKAFTMGKDDDVSYLTAPQASESFKLQLETLLKMIFMGSFIVQPPEVKSGDMPGVAIKLIYSPSIEKAIVDAKEYSDALNTMIKIFKRGFGMEMEDIAGYDNLPVFSWILPYVHQNTAELINNLAVSVQNGFLSKASATDNIPEYAKNDELLRLLKERKESDSADLLEGIK